MCRKPSPTRGESDTIRVRRDGLRLVLWGAAFALSVATPLLEPHRVWPAAEATARPFLTLAFVIVVGAVADSLGIFRFLFRLAIPARASPRVAFAGVLGFTAILSGVVNLDVAVVVAMPFALRVGARTDLPRSWLPLATALTANSTSFLLPTSNLTTLLVLGRAPLSTVAYLRESWVAWLMVSAFTVAVLTLALVGRPNGAARGVADQGVSLRAVLDLAPMFLCASAIRAFLSGGLMLRGGLVEQVGVGSILASSLNNLPAATAVRAIGATGRWAAVLAMAIGSNLIVTGSVATLICRRIARDCGVQFGAVPFSLLGLAIVPLQILVAAIGLHASGALP